MIHGNTVPIGGSPDEITCSSHAGWRRGHRGSLCRRARRWPALAGGTTRASVLIVTGAGAAWTSTSIATNLLFSVACPSVASCVAGATGAVYTGSGTTWRPIAAPGPTQGDLLGAVACPPGTTPCAIAAQSGELTGLQIVAGAAANWAGFDVTPPAPIGSGAFFNAITCPSAATCVAVGTINHQGVIATGPS